MMQRNFFSTVSIDQRFGFLPTETPIRELPEINDYQVALNALVKSLPTLLKHKQVRKAVDTLNERFPHPELILEKHQRAQKNTALLYYAAIAQAYLFEDESNQVAHLPGTIAKPFYALCKSRQRFSVMTYTDYILNNWYLKDPSLPLSLDNIEPILTLTGTADEAWFIKIHVMIEATGASAIAALQDAYFESQRNTPFAMVLHSCLTRMKSALEQVIQLIHRMKEHCDPDFFWDHLRPYLNGWEKLKPKDCEDSGVRFEGIVTKDKKPFIYSGPSGAQSSIVPAIDAGLKIKHEIDGMHMKLLQLMQYMPKEHQAFILQMSNSNIPRTIKMTNDPTLSSLLTETISTLKKLRGAHLQLVHQYIYKPAKEQGIPSHAITGSGGAPIDTYLAGRYAQTKPSLRK